MTLPNIKHQGVLVAATEVPYPVLGLHFPVIRNAFNPETGVKLFAQRLAEEERLVEVVVQSGEDDDTMHALNALDRRPEQPLPVISGVKRKPEMESKVAFWRKWIGLRKIPAAAADVAAKLREQPDEKIVVIVKTLVMLEGMREHLKEFGVVSFYPGTPMYKRTVMLNRFAKKDTYRVLVATAEALGIAVDLSACCRWIAVAEPDWRPHINEQAIRRVYKASQQRPVRVWWYGLENTADEAVVRGVRRLTVKKLQPVDVFS